MKVKVAALILLMAGFPAIGWSSSPTKPDGAQVFAGEIIDTLCAEHKGHQYMMQQMKSMGTDKQTCIQKCLQLGAKLALYDAANGAVYIIANQDQAEPFAGRQVQITGTLNKKKLNISSIRPSE